MNRSVVFVLFIVVAVTAGLFVSSKYVAPRKGMAPDFELKVLDGPGQTIRLDRKSVV